MPCDIVAVDKRLQIFVAVQKPVRRNAKQIKLQNVHLCGHIGGFCLVRHLAVDKKHIVRA